LLHQPYVQDQRVGNAAVPAPAGSFEYPQPVRAPIIGRPKSVQVAEEKHAKLLARLDELGDTIAHLRTAAVEAKAADLRDSVELVAAGKQPLRPDQRTEATIRADLDEALRERLIVARAARKTRAELVAAVVDARDG
jgi:hypothetical protein